MISTLRPLPLLTMLLTACGAGSASPRAPSPGANAEPSSLEARAAALHRSAIVVDTHNDVTTPILETNFDLGRPDGRTHTDLARMKAGGLGAVFFAVYVDKVYVPGAARRALEMIDSVYQQIERHPQELVLATNVGDIRRAKRDGKIAVLMGIEGGHAIENSLHALRVFRRLGVRYMTLTHTTNNDWADSAGLGEPEPPRHGGLSPYGVEVVREMQRIGMLVDVSHVSDGTFWSVLRVAKAPVIASHSSSRAVASHRRNLTDDMLRALAANGGVAMVNFSTGFLDPHCIELRRAQRGPCPPAPFSLLLDHIDHMVKVAGVDHVGLGSDFDGVPTLPEGLDGVDKLPRITEGLLRRGYSDDAIRKILGENFLRVLDAADAFATATGTTLSGDGSTRRLEPEPRAAEAEAPGP